MRIKLLIGTALAVAGLLAGCGGGGSKSSSQTGSLRTLMGYVYVKSSTNTNSSDPDVIITPASTPPAEPHKYDIPTAGSITLIAENGTFLQKTSGGYTGATFTKDLSTGNDIILNVQLESGGQVNVAGSGVTSGSGTKFLTQFTSTLADGNPSGTTVLLRSPGDPETRTPDRTSLAEVKFTLDGITPESTNDIIAGDRKFLAIGYIDANGLAVPGVRSIGSGVSVTSSASAKVQVDTTNNILTTAVKGQTAGDVTIHVSISTPSAVEGDVNLAYGFGDPANVAVYRKTSSGITRMDIASLDPVTMRWNIATSPRTSSIPSSINLVAEVTNKYGATIPDLTVDWSDVKAPSNTWDTGAGGYAFVDPTDDEVAMPSSTTDTNGQAFVTFKAPTDIDGPLTGRPGDGDNNEGEGDQSVKGLNFVYATVHGTTAKNTNPAKAYITRQYASLVIAESTTGRHESVNAYTRVPYTVYARDVDGWESKDAYAVSWTVTNVLGGQKVGDYGEREFVVTPTPTSFMEGNYLNTSSVSGVANIVAYVGDKNDPEAVSEAYPVYIMGPPTQLTLAMGDDGARTNAWELGKVALETNPLTTKPYSEDPFTLGMIPSTFELYGFTPDSSTPPAYWCYHYLGVYDAGGAAYPVLPSQYTLTTTNYRCTVTTPSSPTGGGGSQPVIVKYGPTTVGDFTISLSGSWAGYSVGGDDIPLPSTTIPFSLYRKVRVRMDM